MLVRVVRLFAAVALLGCLATGALFVQLYSWRSDIIRVGEESQQRVELVLTHRYSGGGESVETSTTSRHLNSSNFKPDLSEKVQDHLKHTFSSVVSMAAGVNDSHSTSTATKFTTHPSSSHTSSSHTSSSHPSSSHTEVDVSSEPASASSTMPPAPHSNTTHSLSTSHIHPSSQPEASTPHLQVAEKLSAQSDGSNQTSAALTLQSPIVRVKPKITLLPSAPSTRLHKSLPMKEDQQLLTRDHMQDTLQITQEILKTHPTSPPRLARATSTATASTEAHPSQGFILAVNYYEQQTMGLRNMMQLQCWAQSLKLLVVKPVIHDSFLRTPLDSPQQARFLQFEDSFDLTEWNRQAERLDYAPLVPWREFLSRAPRDVVLVQFEHPSVSLLKSRQKSGQGLLHSPASLQYTTGCSGKWPTASELQFLKSNGFRIVRTACFNFFNGDQLSLDTFNQHILAGRSPGSVSVVMEMWRGISSAQRVLLKDVCHNTALVQEHLALSARLTQHADQYIHKYLAGQPYLAIMGRLEMTQLTVHKKVPVVPFCLEETLSRWREFKQEKQLDRTFLSIDIGRYGSKKYRSGLQPELETAFLKFFQTLFGTSLTVKEWERRFELIATMRDAGYIGLLQKVLVTRAKCILFVGGGAFQRHALYLYQQLHPDPRDQCYSIVKKCTRSNKLA